MDALFSLMKLWAIKIYSDMERTASFFKRFYLFIFEEGERKVERENERSIDQVPLTCPPTRGLASHPGLCPDGESNLRPFGFRDNTHPNEPQLSRDGLLFP